MEDFRFFKIETNKLDSNLADLVNVDFSMQNSSYVFVSEEEFYEFEPSQSPDSTFGDDDDEFIETKVSAQSITKAKQELEKVVLKLLKQGAEEITYQQFGEYKRQHEEHKKNAFANNFSPEEKMVIEKLKSFVEEYDITNSADKMIIASLRKRIVDGLDVTDAGIKDHIKTLGKDHNKVLTNGLLGMVSDYAITLQTKILEVKNLTKETETISTTHDESVKKGRGRPKKN